jgi:hypothetical protein
MVVDFDTGGESCELVLGGWRRRMLRRAGLCAERANRLALTGEIDVEEFYVLLAGGMKNVVS